MPMMSISLSVFLVREKDGHRQAKQINAMDYIETSPLTGAGCLQVFQRVIEEIQHQEQNPFSSTVRFENAGTLKCRVFDSILEHFL